MNDQLPAHGHKVWAAPQAPPSAAAQALARAWPGSPPDLPACVLPLVVLVAAGTAALPGAPAGLGVSISFWSAGACAAGAARLAALGRTAGLLALLLAAAPLL